MDKIISTYDINLSTLALIPGKSIDYEAMVLTEDGIKYVLETPFNLIKKACLHNDWTTYEGRRQAVIKHIGHDIKTPMPIDISKGIYFFPTHSPLNINNVWLAFKHIRLFTKLPKEERTEDAQTIVYFKNRVALKLSVSYYSLEKQYSRTQKCVELIDKTESNINFLEI